MLLCRPLLLCAVLFGWVATELEAQDDPPQAELGAHPDEGKIIRAIRFEGSTSTERITRFLRTRAGNPLRQVDVAKDIQVLWERLKIVAGVDVEDSPDGGIVVIFVIIEPENYDRIAFRGLDHFTETQARSFLGVAGARRISDVLALDHARDLEERYRLDGYYHARVTLERDEENSTLTLVVDEGPKVTVRYVHFRGNSAFPGSAPLNIYRNLIGGSELDSKPRNWLVRGSPYSDEAVEADLEKLRIHYRSLGYRDARVELARREFSHDLSEVDLTFRVIEGRRYRIRSVRLEHRVSETELDTDPLYSQEELLAETRVKSGDYYDRDEINRDKRAIERFYGKRGHPVSGRYGQAVIPDALRWVGSSWRQPIERFDPETAEIDLIYQLIEGTPKRLHDVVIRGNTDTQDRIVRRKVQLFPGETLDISKVDRSLELLDALRYFQDPVTLLGPRFELLPVEDLTDEIDLEIQVQEGDTGSFLWGAGVSTGLGVQGRIQFSKRNFDLFRPPSSFNPGTILSEIIGAKAFHGAGQELELLLQPGTEISQYQISLQEPDLFGSHFDTIGARIQGYRQLRLFDSYQSDAAGVILSLQRNISEDLQFSLSARQETVEIDSIDANAPALVFDAEGQTEIRSLLAQARWRDLDRLLEPTEGHEISLSAELGGGLLGAEEDFYKFGASARYYYRLYRDSLERSHVLFISQRFDFGKAFSNTDDLFLTERYHMGGSTLRGFDQRRAGPTQFQRPLGGEARYLSRMEYQFPLVSTRLAGALRETELLRGVVFSDWGLLGTEIDDSSFSELRLSIGVGVRIRVPYLGLPIALDLGLPVLYEETDDRRPFYFSLSR